MTGMVNCMVQALVDKPDQVKVTARQGERGDVTILTLTVAPEDMGKVIGKNGKIARAMRTIVKAASVHNNRKYVLEIE